MNTRRWVQVILLFAFITATPAETAGRVKVTVEPLQLPTYKLGPDERQPLYRSFRVPGQVVFRGDRSIYPYPKADNFQHGSSMVTYEAITLENEFIKAVILPDLRGRLQGALDKRNGWDFLYFNHVIKPGDIAVRGAWIAGGIEWNHPGGHGYTQFSRISSKIIENEDGSASVLVAEIEPIRKMKWETVITLRPGSLAIETEGRFFSIAPYPIPFASSTNGTMHATDDLEIIYPEGTYITGHGKRYLKPWPVYDGVDHRFYRNLDRPYSIFSEGSREDFFGCYSHDQAAGTVIVTDHRKAPGKKYFSWGSGAQGRRWDTLLSDNDGPYVELQVGAFWENLGYGYGWLEPLEVKGFKVLWYPVKDIGGFVKANKYLAINLKKLGDGQVLAALQAVQNLSEVALVISSFDQEVFRRELTLSPAEPFSSSFLLPSHLRFEDLQAKVISLQTEDTLIRYTPLREYPSPPELPPRRKPMDQLSMDQLYHWGQSWYQEPFGTDAESYYKEMLRRDPSDSRANRAMGVISLHRGEWQHAVEYLTRSLHYDPLDQGFVSHYYLGLAALNQEDLATAKSEFTTASRRGQVKIPALYHLALVAMRERRYEEAVRFLEEGLDAGATHPRFFSTMAVAYRRMGAPDLAQAAVRHAFKADPLEFTATLEEWLSSQQSASAVHRQFDRQDPSFVGSQLYIEGGRTYAVLGDYEAAQQVLELGIRYFEGKGDKVYAMLDYYLGWVLEQLGKLEKARLAYQRASGRSPDYVFPYGAMDVRVLEAAVNCHPSDGRAWQYLGNALAYLNRVDEATIAWEESNATTPNNAMVLRNLGFNLLIQEQDTQNAINYLELAMEADPMDGRILMELDLLYRHTHQEDRSRAAFEEYSSAVLQRDQLVLRWAQLLLQVKEYERAARLLDSTRFFARESRANIHATYAEAHNGIAENLLAEGESEKALKHLGLSMEYPENLAEGALPDESFARSQYLQGVAKSRLGHSNQAKEIWQEVAETTVPPFSEGVVYQALSLRRLGREKQANLKLRQLVDACKRELEKKEEPVRLYVLSRAYAELGFQAMAEESLAKALEDDPDVVLMARLEASIVSRH
jgi:tetratricopeptide (TPR) repeat protein